MAQHSWTTWALRALPEHSVAKALASALLSVFCLPLLATGAVGPDLGSARTVARSQSAATISRSGDDVIITGSIGNLFKTGSFAGPNRGEKTNRARITPDGLAISRGFDEIRTRLAALRNPRMDPAIAAQSLPGGMINADPVSEDGPPISIASIDPSFLNPALSAIDAAADTTPYPQSPSQQLAYARADAPATDFTAVKDKAGKEVSDKEIWCMATAIYFEARGESYRGQVAVGQVVMNRVAHRLYPDTICAVVFQNQNMRNACQFSFACDGRPETVTDKKSWTQANEIARGVINGSLYLTEVANATHYHASYVYPDWAPRLKRVTKIGMHIFYRFKHA